MPNNKMRTLQKLYKYYQKYINMRYKITKKCLCELNFHSLSFFINLNNGYCKTTQVNVPIAVIKAI